MLLKLKKPASSNMYRKMEDFSFIQQIVSSKTGEVLGLAAINYKKATCGILSGCQCFQSMKAF